MITLYRPILIETAEQAEALPVGTVVIRRGDSGPWQKVANRRMGNHYRGDLAAIGDPGLVGHTALVPIEAEEEWAAFTGITDSMLATHFPHGVPLPGHGSVANLPRKRRYVTPWEESR